MIAGLFILLGVVALAIATAPYGLVLLAIPVYLFLRG